MKFRRNGIIMGKNKRKKLSSPDRFVGKVRHYYPKDFVYVWEGLISVRKIFNDPGTEN